MMKSFFDPLLNRVRMSDAPSASDSKSQIGGGGTSIPTGQSSSGAVDSVNGQTGAVVLTKSDVGLANADNTSDANKPVSSATQTALDAKQASDADLTAIAALDSTVAGTVATDGAGWIKKTYAQFKTALSLVKGDVGLGNVDNTSDANKPVSTAQQTALDGKQPLDSDLTTIAGLAATTDNFMVATASAWASRTPTQARTQLGLGSLATQSGTFSGTSSGTNTGDQTSIVGITGSTAQFNAALNDGDFATGGGTATGTNTGDQTSVSGNAGTATALQTSRNIDGQAFNGTADITVIAPGTHAATSKVTPVDADEVPLVDSAASNVLKKVLWSNIKATLKTYFDTLYQATGSYLTSSSIDDTAYDATSWNGDTTHAPSKNAVRDKIETLGAGTPATTVTDETSYGLAKAVGVATNYAREDHTHGSQATTKDKTAITGVLKGNGTDVSAATDGTDYFSSSRAIPVANDVFGIYNLSAAIQSQLTVAGTYYYITGSALTMPASSKTGGGMSTSTYMVWRFKQSKNNVGTAAYNIRILRGTNGTIADTADVTQSIGTATAAVDKADIVVIIKVTATGATGSYDWGIFVDHKAATGVGFGTTDATPYFSGSVSSVAMNTSSLIFGIAFSNTTGTPTILTGGIVAQCYNMS